MRSKWVPHAIKPTLALCLIFESDALLDVSFTDVKGCRDVHSKYATTPENIFPFNVTFNEKFKDIKF